MATLDDKLLQKLEKLGMIHIDESKKEEIKKNLSDILGFVDNISTLDLEDVELERKNLKTPLREDIKQNDSTISENVLKNAPDSKEGYFIVPKIIE
ncbi:Asp-tRNA(Asn)/Glu-tRNA(Gln) amidotransferase subunit GatC [Helicobacter cappadocius]|uniref:Aspartyl/glutamyl-tRNA(Asn/Gln) amidotransferase subunit C n=1 Tax=Helicobacter cappadocius TaxID=3063998 RepID=A0AA90Q3B0_9HELI|nr:MULTISPECIES: Asp-tRNA(Asn)/Glu-tRNA(Gln) amidotransferase subunit GatC [unclassified Helicobacter]MDO7253368.1 Asp-tRNA(Asn)/Glu-tRNA(Gln) amidotransferase subunit GatC [Helicobacter sp. faydin-H75]MDP2539368.1 Asp-tRNA(Asn)/Glu-tRNA(Gln) amidotransferase subunit GatC [Helicobacter sp. faydin-H76]